MDTLELKNFPILVSLKKYFQRIKKSKIEYAQSLSTSKDEFLEDLYALFDSNKNQLPKKFIFLIKDLLGSGLWVSYSYIRYLRSIFFLDVLDESFLKDPIHKHIIDCIATNKSIRYDDITQEDIFNSVFQELCYSFLDNNFKSKLNVPKLNVTIVLVSGVFNELFKTAAFERGVGYVAHKYGYRYFIPQVSGFHCSSVNSEVLKRQLKKYIDSHPDEKLWIVAHSKGGLDALHFLEKNNSFANKYLYGISTIASPIIGSKHTEHKLLKGLNKLTQLKFYQFVDKGRDLIRAELKKSLSTKYQGLWFRKNYKKLPKKIFYSSVALQSDFHESHFWMMMAKIFFPSKGLNDGIVDAEDAKFPHYFPAYHFGILNGHHLSGSRSSSFNQEALIKAHLIVLNYFEEFKK